LGGVILPALCAWNIVRPENILRKHCSSQFNYLKLLLLASLSLKILTLFTIFLLIILALFIIRTGVSYFLFSKFLPIKGRQWKPMLTAKYRMEHNHASEYCYVVTSTLSYVIPSKALGHYIFTMLQTLSLTRWFPIQISIIHDNITLIWLGVAREVTP
jgi:hypothetical protein